MPRIRTLKPEFPQSESMGRISREARYCFIMLWTLADDSGRLRGNSRMLASLLFPYDDDAPRLIDGWLAELEQQDCVVFYEVEGSTYLQIANWLKHQKIDRPTPSKIPEFDESSRALASPRAGTWTKDLDQGPNTLSADASEPREKAFENFDLFPDVKKLPRNGTGRVYPEEFEEFWGVYPVRPGDAKADAYSAWRKGVLKQKLEPSALKAAAERYATHNAATGCETKQVATWFNKEGFDADYDGRALNGSRGNVATLPCGEPSDAEIDRIMREKGLI